MLHKDLHLVTRHDRNKSSQYSAHLGAAHAGKNPSMRHGASESHSNYLPSQQYELANMESQPSSMQHDPMSRNLRSSEVPGQFDSQISLQLYGGGLGTNPSPGDMGVVTTVTNNMQSTQASTIPTQQVGGLAKKGRGKAIAGVKGGQKRIPTNQKQLQTRKKIVGSESESTSADQQSNSSKN